jgi:hypothetical protein
MRNSRACLVVAGLLPGLLGACYSYRSLATTPAPSSRVSLVLTDQGRAEAAERIGPQTERVEGAVVSSTDSAYLLAVSAVQPISGQLVRWSGETVTVRRDQVALLYERRLSKGRTALFAGAVVGVVVAAISTSLFGFGSEDVPIVPPGEGGGQDQ